jgi:hypothetical protein
MTDPQIAKIVAEFRRQLDEADDPAPPPVPVKVGAVAKPPRVASPRVRPAVSSPRCR